MSPFRLSKYLQSFGVGRWNYSFFVLIACVSSVSNLCFFHLYTMYMCGLQLWITCFTLMKQHIHICEAHKPQLWTIENEGSESKEKAM